MKLVLHRFQQLCSYTNIFKQPISTRVEKKNAKICKISGEKLVFSPQIFYIILRWNSVNAVKLCKFTARLSGDLTKIHHNSPLKYVISPPFQGSEPLTSCMSSSSSSTAPSIIKFYYFLFEYKSNSLYFLQNMWIFVRFAIFSGEITYFSGEMWWIFVSSPLTLVVKLHKVTA